MRQRREPPWTWVGRGCRARVVSPREGQVGEGGGGGLSTGEEKGRLCRRTKLAEEQRRINWPGRRSGWEWKGTAQPALDSARSWNGSVGTVAKGAERLPGWPRVG